MDNVYEKAKRGYYQSRSTDRDIRKRQNIALGAEFKRDLEKFFGTENYPKKDELFRYAWEDASSHGFDTVCNVYENLLEIIVL